MNRTVLTGVNQQRPQLDRPPPDRERTVMMDRSQTPTIFARNSHMTVMFFTSCEILSFASVLPQIGANLPAPETLLAHVTALFDRMNQQAREAGVSPEDVRQAQYALAAFVDEQALAAQWPGRYMWQQRPLQLQWFGENTAGDNFFERMDALARQPNQAHVLQVYVLCLAHGFQGRHGMSEPHKLAPMLEQKALSLTPALPPLEPLSPNAVRIARRQMIAEAPMIRLALAFLGAAIVIFVIFRIAISSSASTAEKAAAGFVTPAVSSGGAK